jgi:hypothetical protein
MIAIVLIAILAGAAVETPSVGPPPTYTVADVIGRNPDDVCTLAYRSGRWTDWLKSDGAEHHARRDQRVAMEHYCDGFIHGMKYKGQ